jgi:hypothetical protein
MIQRVPARGPWDIGTDWKSVCEGQAEFLSILLGWNRFRSTLTPSRASRPTRETSDNVSTL